MTFAWLPGAQVAIRAARELGLPTIVDVDLTVADVPNDIVESAIHLVFSQPALVKLAGQSTSTER